MSRPVIWRRTWLIAAILLFVGLGLALLWGTKKTIAWLDNQQRLSERARTLTTVANAQISNWTQLMTELPACDDDGRLIENRSFSTPIPYLISPTAQHFTAALEQSNLKPDLAITALLPEPRAKPLPIRLTYREGKPFLEIIPDRLPAELTAFDFGVLAMRGKEHQDVCRLDGRLHLAASRQPPPQQPLTVFGRLGFTAGRFSLPYGTDIDPKRQTLLVSDCTNGLLQEFDFAGRLIALHGAENGRIERLSRPADVKLHDNKIYITEENGHRIRIIGRDGTAIKSIGTKKIRLRGDRANHGSNAEFNQPLGVAVDRDGLIYVVDYGNKRIQKITEDGRIIKVFGGDTLYAGRALRDPYYIDIDPETQSLFVVDRSQARIVVFDRAGRFKYEFGEKGSGATALDWPHEIQVTKDGRVFVADTNNRRIQIFHTDGTHIGSITTGPHFALPKTVAVTDDGLVFVGHLGEDAYVTVWQDPAKPSLDLKAFVGDLSRRPPLQRLALSQQADELKKNFNGTVYERFCSSCHATGAMSAPRPKIADDWSRFPRDVDTLLELARQGKGAMIPSGGCPHCSDDELREAIRFMIPEDW